MELEKIQATIKSGQERLSFNGKPLDFALLDFWRWSVSDLLANTTRGRFAEFVVATATNIDTSILREEWALYDLETPDGIKLEVKSAAYIQTWFQRALSKISFGTRATLCWDSLSNTYTSEKKHHADVYVFCLLHPHNKSTVDPLNMNHWEFYVMATKELNDYTRSQHSITLNSLQRLTTAVSYEGLYEAIKAKHTLNGDGEYLGS